MFVSSAYGDGVIRWKEEVVVVEGPTTVSRKVSNLHLVAVMYTAIQDVAVP